MTYNFYVKNLLYIIGAFLLLPLFMSAAESVPSRDIAVVLGTAFMHVQSMVCAARGTYDDHLRADIKTELNTIALQIRAIFKDKKVHKRAHQSNFLLACANGNKAMVDVFLNAGFKVNMKTCHNKTPLMAAAHAGNCETVQFLLEQGAKRGIADKTNAIAKDYTYLIPLELNKSNLLVMLDAPERLHSMMMIARCNIPDPFARCRQLLQ